MLEKIVVHIITEHRGKLLGVVLGLAAAILFLNYGFWRSIFVMFCIAAGYFIGKNLDEKASFHEWLNKLFKSDQF